MSNKSHLIKSAGQLVPHLKEGQTIMSNGLKKDTSRYSTGSLSSNKDITKGVKQAKKRAVQNYNNRVNAEEKNDRLKRTYHKAKFQIEISERAEVLDPEAFLKNKERTATRKEERKAAKELKRSSKGR